jgi:hypothetical protein
LSSLVAAESLDALRYGGRSFLSFAAVEVMADVEIIKDYQVFLVVFV